MSTENPTPVAPSRRRQRKQEKKSLWQMDISSLGKKDQATGDERLDRPAFQPTLPQVNLLPKSVMESMAMARVRKWTIVAVLLVLVAAGGIWWLQGSAIDQAQSDLTAAQAENTKLRAQVNALAPVNQMYEQITRLQGVVTTTLAAQPQASVVMDRLVQAGRQVDGSPIALTNMDITYTGIPQPGGPLSSCPNPDPFGSQITIGCLTFTANATSRDQVSQLLRILEQDPLFIGPYVTSTTASEVQAGANGNRTQSIVAFSGSAGVSLDGLKTLLTQEQIDAILAPPKPQPSPSASEGAVAE
ncbi:MAG: hypothetical protein GC156_03665 [Actinomycetales bacterium]|nr:hypothetical protein [Actinomycetales bacterium]